jgi:acetylornithine deacetylase/succinyl-diaminopimelate desuccinylase-like protein
MNENRTPRTPVELLQELIRFDTTNPPGTEASCIRFLTELLTESGLSVKVLAKEKGRPNLIARLPGRGEAAPLLLYGHVDVVTTACQSWTHPPFEGRIIDGSVWGRGALDMKSGVAMMTAAVLRAQRKSARPAGDILLAVLSDEETGGRCGGRFLVEEHPDVFADVRYAIGEFGGFPLYVGGRTFYLIQVGEKESCCLRARIRGPAGHGALPLRGGGMARLGRILSRLDRRRLPIHVTPIPRKMIQTIAWHLPLHERIAFRRLLNPFLANRVLSCLGEKGRMFESLLRNTANPTIVRGGNTYNVIPSEITLGLDGRLLPGFSPEDLIEELRRIVGDGVQFDVERHDPGPAAPDYGMLETLEAVLSESAPNAIPVPYLLPGTTDARFFSRLGIQTYGFTPMNLERGFRFFEMIHAADERVPASAVEFGTNVIFQLIERYGPGA